MFDFSKPNGGRAWMRATRRGDSVAPLWDGGPRQGGKDAIGGENHRGMAARRHYPTGGDLNPPNASSWMEWGRTAVGHLNGRIGSIRSGSVKPINGSTENPMRAGMGQEG